MIQTQPDYASIFKQTPAAVAVLDGPDHVFIYINKAYAELIGHDDVVGRTVAEALPEVIEQGFIDLLDGVYKTGKPFIGNEIEISLNSGKGQESETRFLNFIYQPTKNAGVISGIFAHVIDVTEVVESRNAMARLRASAEEESAKYNIVLNSLSDYVCFYDTTGAYQYVNQPLLHLYGLTDYAQIIGKSPREIHDTKTADTLLYDIRTVIKTKKPLTSSMVLNLDGKEERHFEYVFSPVRDGTGAVVAVANVARDTTERYQADKLRQETAELISQRNTLTAMNRLKDEFVSIASHQLRTPATGVKQYLGMVLEGYAGEVPDNLLTFLRTAYDSNERQLRIISDLLKTAQLDSEGFAVTKHLQDINALIGEVVKEVTAVLESRHQKIIFKQKGECNILVDPSEFKIAIENLVVNASKYSPDNTAVTISVGINKAKARISVTDEGVGIAKKNLKKVFEKFTRIDNDLSDTVSGNGVGLYFVQRITELHGGTISVTSQPNKGSTFTMVLPR